MSLWVKFGFDDVRSQGSWIKDLYGTHASPSFTLFLVLNMIGYGKSFHFSRLWKNDNVSCTLFLLLSGLRVRRLKERETGNLFFCCLCSCFRFVLYFISSLLLNFVCSIVYLLFTDICQFIYQFWARDRNVSLNRKSSVFSGSWSHETGLPSCTWRLRCFGGEKMGVLGRFSGIYLI